MREAASRVSSTAAAVWIVRVESADSRSTSIPINASLVAGNGAASSVAVDSYTGERMTIQADAASTAASVTRATSFHCRVTAPR